MANKARNTSGKFAPKSEVPRKVRSVNLTDTAWQWLADVAAQCGVSRNDYLEAMAEGGVPFMETVGSEILPLMETVEVVGDREEIKAELADLAQLKKQVKEHAAELHREEHCLEFEKARWQQELSDARCDLTDAKATILNQSNKIRELERGYSFKPNPAESRLRLEIGNLQAELAELQSQLETERADREEIQVQLSELKQNSAPVATLSQKPTPDAATILSKLRAKRKKSKTDLVDLEVILGILEGNDD